MSISVLVVEDEGLLRDAYELVLKSQGFEVETAHNGEDALHKLKKKSPDIVLLDLFMPVMNGKEFLANINLDDYPQTKVIAYSNISDKTTEAEVLKLGAKKLVLKASTGPKDLIKLIQEVAVSKEM